MLSDLTPTFITRGKNAENRISLQTKRNLTSRTSTSMTKVFHFAWLTKTGNRTWKVSGTQGMTKRTGQEIGQLSKLRCRVSSDCTDVIYSFAIVASVKLLWNVMVIYWDKPNYKAFRWAFTVIQRIIYPENYTNKEYGQLDLFPFKLKIIPSTPVTNSMPFLILGQDHLRSTSGIICGSGSFAV